MGAGLGGLGFHPQRHLLAGGQLGERLTDDLAGDKLPLATRQLGRLDAVGELHQDFHVSGRAAAAVHHLDLIDDFLAGRSRAGRIVDDELELGDCLDFRNGIAGRGKPCLASRLHRHAIGPIDQKLAANFKLFLSVRSNRDVIGLPDEYLPAVNQFQAERLKRLFADGVANNANVHFPTPATSFVPAPVQPQ